jgi:hypothetical protein
LLFFFLLCGDLVLGGGGEMGGWILGWLWDDDLTD